MADKIGFFGGTFDPIHIGHLNLAVELMETHHLKEVWFCPANLNPHKTNQIITPIRHRMVMTELAICSNPNFRLLDIECNREGPSYTVDTLQELIARENKHSDPRQIFLLMSEEAAASFPKWRKPEEIIKMVKLLIGSRHSKMVLEQLENNNPSMMEAIQKGWTLTHCMDISSTFIRERLHKGLYCSHLIPEKVLDYIYQNQLYFSS